MVVSGVLIPLGALGGLGADARMPSQDCVEVGGGWGMGHIWQFCGQRGHVWQFGRDGPGRFVGNSDAHTHSNHITHFGFGGQCAERQQARPARSTVHGLQPWWVGAVAAAAVAGAAVAAAGTAFLQGIMSQMPRVQSLSIACSIGPRIGWVWPSRFYVIGTYVYDNVCVIKGLVPTPPICSNRLVHG